MKCWSAPSRNPTEVAAVDEEQSVRISTRAGDAGLCTEVLSEPCKCQRVQETMGWRSCCATDLELVIPPAPGFCQPGGPKIERVGVALYSDDQHYLEPWEAAWKQANSHVWLKMVISIPTNKTKILSQILALLCTVWIQKLSLGFQYGINYSQSCLGQSCQDSEHSWKGDPLADVCVTLTRVTRGRCCRARQFIPLVVFTFG